VAVEPDAIYVHDNDVWTSAGVTAGIDLALALVADDHGARAAGEVARQLVVYLRRSGGQAQFSAVLAAQSSDHEPVRDVLTWLTDNLTADLSIPALAAQATLLGPRRSAAPSRCEDLLGRALLRHGAAPSGRNDTAHSGLLSVLSPSGRPFRAENVVVAVW